mgnify:CR=1 FL=1
MPQLGPYTLTPRGFQVIEFMDANGARCSLQQSSLAVYEQAGSSAVWLGTHDHRMHLRVDQVEALVEQLWLWLDNGHFENEPDAGVDS